MSRVTRQAGRGGGTECATAQPAVLLFKIISARDEVVIGLAPEQLSALGGSDAGAVGRALNRNGELTAWQFAVRRRKNGRLEQAPLRQVSILGHESIRVEPYATPADRFHRAGRPGCMNWRWTADRVESGPVPCAWFKPRGHTLLTTHEGDGAPPQSAIAPFSSVPPKCHSAAANCRDCSLRAMQVTRD